MQLQTNFQKPLKTFLRNKKKLIIFIFAGEDPLDPEGRSNFRGNNPFEHFQHFQHGSPFQFKFHFS